MEKKISRGEPQKQIGGMHTPNMAFRDEDNILDQIQKKQFRIFIMKDFIFVIGIYENAYLQLNPYVILDILR